MLNGDKTLILANTPTRLKRLEPDAQERLINRGPGEWGAIEVDGDDFGRSLCAHGTEARPRAWGRCP